ncbi:hypothetical protein QFZ79_002940 [Arthrobacter sp. V4I6]|nr:hypothetical protein [Arthrobacter sp. V4I6]MDQ0854829.1 hypothetical protein [Arthrobacter sp. V4I6]
MSTGVKGRRKAEKIRLTDRGQFVAELLTLLLAIIVIPGFFLVFGKLVGL